MPHPGRKTPFLLSVRSPPSFFPHPTSAKKIWLMMVRTGSFPPSPLDFSSKNISSREGGRSAFWGTHRYVNVCCSIGRRKKRVHKSTILKLSFRSFLLRQIKVLLRHICAPHMSCLVERGGGDIKDFWVQIGRLARIVHIHWQMYSYYVGCCRIPHFLSSFSYFFSATPIFSSL